MPLPDTSIATSAVVTLSAAAASSFLPEDKGGEGSVPSFRQLFAIAVTFTGLSIMQEFAPQIANGLALSIMVTVMTYKVLPIITAYFSEESP